MPKFKYVGDSPRVFPDLSLEVEPGDVLEFEENPDPNFWADAPAKAKVTDEKEA